MLIRHSLSCSNLVRWNAELIRNRACKDSSLKTVCSLGCASQTALRDYSQKIRDPGLTALGRKMADTYGSKLRKQAEAAGFDLNKATIGSSSLRRAKETAALLFPAAKRVIFPHLSEHGEIPENTPTEHRLTAPGWHHFLNHIYKQYADKHKDATEPVQLIAVSHNGYISDVWWEMTSCDSISFNNLDAIVIDGELDADGTLLPDHGPKYIRYKGIQPTDRRVAKDHCPMPRKTRRAAKQRRKTHRKSRR